MTHSAKVEKILSQIRKLDKESRLYLMQRLSRQSRGKANDKESTALQLIELNSLGSEIWKEIDIDEYIQQERNFNSK